MRIRIVRRMMIRLSPRKRITYGINAPVFNFSLSRFPNRDGDAVLVFRVRSRISSKTQHPIIGAHKTRFATQREHAVKKWNFNNECRHVLLYVFHVTRDRRIRAGD